MAPGIGTCLLVFFFSSGMGISVLASTSQVPPTLSCILQITMQ